MVATNILRQVCIGVKDGLVVSALLGLVILVCDFVAEILLNTDIFIGI